MVRTVGNLYTDTVGYARTNVIGPRTSGGRPFQAHSLEQNYHPTQPFKQEKCNTKSNIQDVPGGMDRTSGECSLC